jgi:hypothetical protein
MPGRTPPLSGGVHQRSTRRSSRLAVLAHTDEEIGEVVAAAITHTGKRPNAAIGTRLSLLRSPLQTYT